MNQKLVYKYLFIIILIAGSSQFYSCKDDEQFDFPGDNMNRVFFPIENYTVNTYDRYVFSVKHTPLGSSGDQITIATPVRSAQAVSADVRVSLAIDNSLTEAYNAAKGTNYSRIPDGMVDLNTGQLTIRLGQQSSADSLKFSVSAEKYSQLTDSAYLVPLAITSVAGADNAAVSSNRNILYIVIRTSQTNVYDNTVLNDMTGSLLSDRSGWSATLNASLDYGTFSNMFDGRTNTYWYISPSKKVSLAVDLNNTYPGITGIRIHTSSTTYALTAVTISTSADGNSWIPQGLATLSASSAYQYIKFYSPVSARYIKLDIEGWRSATYIRMAEFDVYTSN